MKKMAKKTFVKFFQSRRNIFIGTILKVAEWGQKFFP